MTARNKSTQSPKEQETQIWKLIGCLAAKRGKVRDIITQHGTDFDTVGVYEATVMTRKVTPSARDEDIGFFSGGQCGDVPVVIEDFKSRADDGWSILGASQDTRQRIAVKIETKLKAFLLALKKPDIYRKEPKAFLNFFQSLEREQTAVDASPNTLFVRGDSPIPHVLLMESGEIDFFCTLYALRSLLVSSMHTGASVDEADGVPNIEWLKLGFFVSSPYDRGMRYTPRWRAFTQWLAACSCRVKHNVDSETLKSLLSSVGEGEIPNDKLREIIHSCGLPVKILNEYALQEAFLLVEILNFFSALPEDLLGNLRPNDDNLTISEVHLGEFVGRLKHITRSMDGHGAAPLEESDPIMVLARPPSLKHEYDIRAYQPLPLHIMAVAMGFKKFSSVRVPASLVLATLRGSLFSANPKAEQREVLGAHWALMTYLANEISSETLEVEARESVWAAMQHEVSGVVQDIVDRALIKVSDFQGQMPDKEFLSVLANKDYANDLLICPAYRTFRSVRELLLMWSSRGISNFMQRQLNGKNPEDVIKSIAAQAVLTIFHRNYMSAIYSDDTAEEMPSIQRQLNEEGKKATLFVNSIAWDTGNSQGLVWAGETEETAVQERQINFQRLISALFMNLEKHRRNNTGMEVRCQLHLHEKFLSLRIENSTECKSVGGTPPPVKTEGSFATIAYAAGRLNGRLHEPGFIPKDGKDFYYFQTMVVFSIEGLFRKGEIL